MFKKYIYVFSIPFFILILSLNSNGQTGNKNNLINKTKKSKKVYMKNKIIKSESEWKKDLSEMEYFVLREKGTEKPYTNEFYHHKGNGVYVCAACGNELFNSEQKYDSGSGWPAFWDILSKENVILKDDNSLGMKRVEVLCARCEGHLGHMFPDGPEPTYQRYCINSVSMDFKKNK